MNKDTRFQPSVSDGIMFFTQFITPTTSPHTTA